MSEPLARYRPLWSFFILSTEKWLGALSAAGLELVSLDFRGHFTFRRTEPRPCRYCFFFAKFDAPQSRRARLGERGWEEIAHAGRWRIFRASGEAGAMPNRRGLYLRNNSLLYLYAVISSFFLLLAFAVSFLVFLSFARRDASDRLFFRGSTALIGLFAALLLGNFSLFMHLSVGNNRILEEPGAAGRPERVYRQYLKNKTFERWLEKLLIREGDILLRFRPLWILLPRSLENWLGRREAAGFNLYKVGGAGMLFYFVKASPRAMCYCVVNSEGEDISRALAAGWNVAYSSSGQPAWFGRTVLFCRPRTEGAPPTPFSTQRAFMGNALRLTLRGVASLSALFVLSLLLLAGFLYAGAARGAVFAAGAAMAAFGVLILRLMAYFLHSFLLARRYYP